MISRIILSGQLSCAPDRKTTVNGSSICVLHLAVNDRVKDRDTGAWSERSHCFAVDVCGALGERCQESFVSGDEVTIAGRLRWQPDQTDDGKQCWRIAIIADRVELSPARERSTLFESALAVTETPVAADFAHTIPF